MTITITKRCHDPDLLNTSRDKLNEQRKNGKYCDYTITTDDGKTFTLHKNILESVSPFFELLFAQNDLINNDNDHDIDTDIININNNDVIKTDLNNIKSCPSDILEKCIEFMYTGNTDIPINLAKNTIPYAKTLKLNGMIDCCSKALIDNIDDNNYMDIFYSTIVDQKIYNEPLIQKCNETFFKQFDINPNIINDKEFLQLEYDTIKNLINCDNKNVCNDEKLYKTICSWIDNDYEEREKYIPELLDKIQIKNLTIDFAKNNLLNNKNNPLYKNEKFIENLTSTLNDCYEDKILHKKGSNKICNSDHKYLYTITSNNNDIYMFDNDNCMFNIHLTNLTNKKLNTFGTTVLSNQYKLFICGGICENEIYDKCELYSLKDNNWLQLKSMQNKRNCHRAKELNNKIYVCGNGIGILDNTIEIYDYEKNDWYYGPELNGNGNNHFMGLCILDNCLYALKKNFQRYDIRDNKWITLPYYEYDNDIIGSIGYDNKIMGFTKNNICMFDCRNNKWFNSFVDYNKSYDAYPEICNIDNNIYIIEKNEYDSGQLLQSFNASDLSFRYQLYTNIDNNSHINSLFAM